MATGPNSSRGLPALAEHDSDIMDPRDRLRLAERHLIIPAMKITTASSRAPRGA